MNTFSIGDRVIVDADSGNKQIGTVVDINDIPFETIRNEIKRSGSMIPIKGDRHITDWNGLVDNFTPGMNYYDGYPVCALTPAIELSRLPEPPNNNFDLVIKVSKKDHIKVVEKLKSLGWIFTSDVFDCFTLYPYLTEELLVAGCHGLSRSPEVIATWNPKSHPNQEYKEIWIDDVCDVIYDNFNKCSCNGPSKEVAIGLSGAAETIKVCIVCKKEK